MIDICNCGIKKLIDTGSFDLFEVVQDVEYLAKIGKLKETSNDDRVSLDTVIAINSSFNCGNRLFDRKKLNKSLFKNSCEFIELSKLEIDEFYSKLNKINSKAKAINEFGKNYSLVNKEYLINIKETTEYDEVIKETLIFEDTFETIEISLDFYFDGIIGHTINQKLN